MKFYALVKCWNILSHRPEWSWENGMLLRDENFSPKYLGTFTDLAEAKKELAKCVCKANFRGGISNETECTEFWLESYEGDPKDDDTWEYIGDDYAGAYPYIKIFDEDEMGAKLDYQGFICIANNLDDAETLLDNKDWCAAHFDEGEHNVILLNMDNEKIKTLKIKVE